MKKHGWELAGLIVLCIFVHSCKLDKPVLPGEPGYITTPDPAATPTVTGTVLNGTTVNNTNLPGTWKVATTTKEFFDQNNVIVSSSEAFDFFTSVTISETAKTANYADLTTAASPTQTYTLSNTNSKLNIQLSADPFSRSVNGQIQIINLSATSMTWVALDPKIVSAGGQLLRNAYQVTFTKQ